MRELYKLVIADDDDAIVDALTMVLEDEYQVVVAEETEVLQTVDAEQPAAVLLDIWMSGCDGRDVCKALTAQDTTKHIPVIFLSASKEIKQSAHEAGAATYIEKPFDITAVLEVVAGVIKEHHG